MLAARAVGAAVAALTFDAEHTIRAAHAISTGITSRVSWVGGEAVGEAAEFFEKATLVERGDQRSGFLGVGLLARFTSHDAVSKP